MPASSPIDSLSPAFHLGSNVVSPSLSPPGLPMRSPLSSPSYLPSRGLFLSFQNSCGVVSSSQTVHNSVGSPPLPPHSTETSHKAVESAPVHTSEGEFENTPATLGISFVSYISDDLAR